jgi:hypothetical protein
MSKFFLIIVGIAVLVWLCGIPSLNPQVIGVVAIVLVVGVVFGKRG